jgi:signal peptidase I
MDGAGGRLLRVAVRLALAASLVLAALSVALPVYYKLLGDQLLVVTSGSMAPTFEPGDAVVMRSAEVDTLRPQMVITFQPINGTSLVTHRIASLHTLPDANGQPTAYVRTRGDANDVYDPDLTPVANIVGVIDGEPAVCGWAPAGCGRLLLWASSPMGRLAIFVPPLLILIAAEIAAIRRARPAPTSGPAVQPAPEWV